MGRTIPATDVVDSWVGRVDLADRTLRIVVEADSMRLGLRSAVGAHHSGAHGSR